MYSCFTTMFTVGPQDASAGIDGQVPMEEYRNFVIISGQLLADQSGVTFAYAMVWAMGPSLDHLTKPCPFPNDPRITNVRDFASRYLGGEVLEARLVSIDPPSSELHSFLETPEHAFEMLADPGAIYCSPIRARFAAGSSLSDPGMLKPSDTSSLTGLAWELIPFSFLTPLSELPPGYRDIEDAEVTCPHCGHTAE